jgi:hypothetical protein
MCQLGIMKGAEQLHHYGLPPLRPKLANLKERENHASDDGQRAENLGDVRERC